MRLISLVLKPKISEDSFKPKWLHKLYITVIGKPASKLQMIYAIIKYNGDILQDSDMRFLLRAAWANEENKQKVRNILASTERIKEAIQEARKNK